MRISGAGHEKLMVIVPMAVVISLAIIVMGGPAPLLESLDHHLSDFFTSVGSWARSVF